ncbi:kinesin-like protein CG14535 [Anabrus simplex]|uniref:kinesin-like protein CG14535 n=1 Tax=Anabrus simplex TaxID=316456 RepID=UPI0035A339FA
MACFLSIFRAAQKLNLSSSPHRRKRHSSGEDVDGTTTNASGFSAVIHRTPPPVPPALLRRIGVKEVSGIGKVKVMLRVCGNPSLATASISDSNGVSTTTSGTTTAQYSSSSSFFNIDARKKQVTLFDPALCGGSSAPEDRRVGVAAPKMFAFDAIFSQDDSQTEICSSALTDVIHAVINGTDGCLFCFGHARLGKTYTMVGTPESVNTLGIIPCAISWLFRGINEQKQKTGARFSVRVSAVEVSGPSQHLKDLLAGHATDSEQSPGVYLRDDPLFGTQLQNQSELRVPSAEKAAFYLDAALSSRNLARDEGRDCHLLYTLHVYQYSVAGRGGVAGGRSRLHLIDLASCERGKASGGIPLSGLGNVLLAIFNGQKHLPHREHKITQLLKECLSSLTCHAAMIAHVSPYAQHYTDTLSTVQLASRIHRMRRRKIKFAGAPAANSSEDAARLQAQENGQSTGSSDVDPSSSEQSADTVIYVGPSDDATDGEHPPVYLPSLNSGDNRCAMGKALRGSSAETRPTSNNTLVQSGRHSASTSTKQSSPQKIVSGNEGSPSHRSTSKTPIQSSSAVKTTSSSHNVSNKSSPVRSINKHSSNKIPSATAGDQLVTSQSGKVAAPSAISTSDEQWIDGPRISKSKVAEARNLLKDSHKKKETWIDGPLQSMKPTGSGHASGSYGFMDSHKKSMIRKWVENQTVEIQKQLPSKNVNSERPPTTGASQQLPVTITKNQNEERLGANIPKEVQESVKVDSTVDYETRTEEPSVVESFELERTEGTNLSGVSVNSVSRENGIQKYEDGNHVTQEEREQEDEDVRVSKGMVNEEQYVQDETSEDNRSEEEEGYPEEGEDYSEDIPPALELFHSHNTGIRKDAPIKNMDMGLRIIEDQQDVYGEEVEIIEVEEPYEPVPMQDSCLQVTEEDIAFCMGEIENPLPEVDQESAEEHPLRILSQENLTVVSTFTDSMSVATDMERNMSQHRFGLPHVLDHTFYHRPFSLYELPNHQYIQHHSDPRMYPDEMKRKHETEMEHRKLLEQQNHFDRLAQLHEIYKNKHAHSSDPKVANQFPSPQYRPPSRYQSLSLSDMLQNASINDSRNSGVGFSESGSIYSEPAYNHYRQTQDQSKICDNCKMSFNRTSSSNLFYPPLLSNRSDKHLGRSVFGSGNICDRDPFQYCNKIPNGGCNISSLRHPDGASNPNLKEVERVPGNGASTSDHEEETEVWKKAPLCEDVRTVTGKASSEGVDDELPPTLPPPLRPPGSSRLHRRLFDKACSRLKPSPHLAPEGYDSGHDSGSPRPCKVSPLPLQLKCSSRPGCESSGYDSVVRDSESSSFVSSQDSDNGSQPELHDPGGVNKVPVLQYCREDVERLERRWTEVRGERIRELRQEQSELKKELAAAKRRLLIPANRWSYELHVEASMDHRNPSFIEALQRETEILRKRVEACKSHILMVTCFDAIPRLKD